MTGGALPPGATNPITSATITPSINTSRLIVFYTANNLGTPSGTVDPLLTFGYSGGVTGIYTFIMGYANAPTSGVVSGTYLGTFSTIANNIMSSGTETINIRP